MLLSWQNSPFSTSVYRIATYFPLKFCCITGFALGGKYLHDVYQITTTELVQQNKSYAIKIENLEYCLADAFKPMGKLADSISNEGSWKLQL